jgi:hypothetical protein
VPHTDVVARDLVVHPPFDRAGKGYRDPLIWLSFLTSLGEVPAIELVSSSIYFVTDNKRDFCVPSGELKQELLAELPHAVEVAVIDRVRDVASLFELPPPTSLESRVTVEAVRFVRGELLFEDLDDDLLPWSTEVEAAEISEVDADDGEAHFIETLEGDTELWSVRIEAELGVTGKVYKGDLAGLDDSLTIVEGDWNKHYAEVHGDIRATILVQVRVEADHETFDAEVQEILTS